jgi:hypothetical protein
MAGVTLAGIPTFDAAVSHVCSRQQPSPDLRALLRLLALREDAPFAMQTLAEICANDEQQAVRLQVAAHTRPGTAPLGTLRDGLRGIGYRRAYCVSVACFLAAAVDAPLRAPAHVGWWRRSARRAVIAQQVANGAAEHVDTVFAAAMFADLGDLLLPVYFPDLYAEAERFGPTPAHERAAWGYTRQDLAAALVRHWGVPDDVADAVALKPCMHCDHRPGVELVDVLERARHLDQRYLEHCGSPLAPRDIFADEPALADRLEREGGLRWLQSATEHIVETAVLEPTVGRHRVA